MMSSKQKQSLALILIVAFLEKNQNKDVCVSGAIARIHINVIYLDQRASSGLSLSN